MWVMWAHGRNQTYELCQLWFLRVGSMNGILEVPQLSVTTRKPLLEKVTSKEAVEPRNRGII